jgi:hypothetical protein
MATEAGREAGAGKRRQRKQARAQRREADRALVPVAVSQRLGVSVAGAARAMRAAGVTGPLTVRQAREWAAGPGSAPQWLLGLWGERMAHAAQQEYHREQQREQQAMRELAVEQSALAKLEAGKRRFTDDERILVEDWAFRAAKDLVRGPGGQVDDFNYRVLRAVGVDPGDHATWLVHAGGCDGEGALYCAERIGQVRAGRRAEALTESVARETALREAGLSPGLTVTAWHGRRVGVVVKVNKVSVKVRFVGGQRDQYALVEKNLDPRHVRPAPESLPPPLLPGGEVVIRDHGGHVRHARVTEVDGPLFEAAYSLKSGQWRSAWFDVLALHPGGAS